MTDQQVINGRLTMTVAEASEMGQCRVDDLFHLAELGKFVIYVIANKWKAARVTEIDHSIKMSPVPPKVYFRGPALPEIPSTDDKDFDEKCRRRIRLEQAQDIICGNVIEYGRFGSLKNVYELTLTGLQPVAVRTFREYPINPESAEVMLDLNLALGLSDKDHERFVYPDPATLVRDSLVNGRFAVMTTDIKRLFGQSPDDEAIEPYGH